MYFAVEIVALNYSGDYPCGNKSGKGLFKSGWKGSSKYRKQYFF